MIGTVTALLIDSGATFFYQLALVFMKIAHQNTERSKTKVGYFQPFWVLGLALMIASTIVRMSKYKFKN